MKTASVSDLKAHLSRYLRLVQKGGEIQILDRGVPVARLVAASGVGEPADARLDRLVASGIVRRGSGGIHEVLAAPAIGAPDADLRRALDEDREDRA